ERTLRPLLEAEVRLAVGGVHRELRRGVDLHLEREVGRRVQFAGLERVALRVADTGRPGHVLGDVTGNGQVDRDVLGRIDVDRGARAGGGGVGGGGRRPRGLAATGGGEYEYDTGDGQSREKGSSHHAMVGTPAAPRLSGEYLVVGDLLHTRWTSRPDRVRL